MFYFLRGRPDPGVEGGEASPSSRLWAEEAIDRLYKNFMDTTHQTHYFKDGRPA